MSHAGDELGRTLKLVVAYDGRRFAGSQRQAGTRTIQGELERACARLFGAEGPCRLAGRTDAGVHAVGQVATVWQPLPGQEESKVAEALQALTPDDVGIRAVEVVADGFDPRRDARWREYRYRVEIGPGSPFRHGLVHRRWRPIDLTAMAAAAHRFEGERDFAAVAGMGAGTPWSEWRTRPRATVRRVLRCECRPVADSLFGSGDRLIEVVVVGDAFLPRQVRGMVGALIEVGEGRREPSWVDDLLAGEDRRGGPATAPAHGLVLWEVGYEPYGAGPARYDTKKDTDGPSHVHAEDRRHHP